MIWIIACCHCIRKIVNVYAHAPMHVLYPKTQVGNFFLHRQRWAVETLTLVRGVESGRMTASASGHRVLRQS